MSNHERSFRSCRLRARSVSTLLKPTRKKPSVTLTARPASGVPRACSLDFIRMPGTLATPPPAKSGGRMKVSSAGGLAGRGVAGVGFGAERHRHFELAVGDLDVGAHGDIGLLPGGRLDLFGAPDHRADI